ncbi:MAG: nucleotide exchange factor GrpE [Alphaproteobacteria bacterium GM7ARS4]|nr:nucleotide exchange factor GrpE [Alphaproteobacteria bacterium GM7ARS4]
MTQGKQEERGEESQQGLGTEGAQAQDNGVTPEERESIAADGHGDGEGVDEASSEGDGEETLESLREEREKLKDKLLRAISDGENERRRFEKDLAEKLKYAHTAFARDVLTLADGFTAALEQGRKTDMRVGENFSTWFKGLETISRDLEQTLRASGIEVVHAEVGKPFDYRWHEAVSQTAEGDGEEGSVVRQLRCGYRIYDRLLRPAMVVVKEKGTPEGQ